MGSGFVVGVGSEQVGRGEEEVREEASMPFTDMLG